MYKRQFSFQTGLRNSFRLKKAVNIFFISSVNLSLIHIFKESEEDNNQPKYPFLCLLVSGGNSQIILVKAYNDMEVLGQTIDDAAGDYAKHTSYGSL